MKDAAETEGARRATGVSADAGVGPDPEVTAKAKRRRFSVEYRLKILRQADACKAPGELGALLRREGLYSSLLSTWRRQRELGALAELRARRRGPKPKAVDPRIKELEKENRRLQRKLKQAEMIIDVQKKVHELLGIPLRSLADEGDE
jgi:transposase-like protein